MKRLLPLVAIMVVVLAFAITADANHDPFHAACKRNRVAIHNIIHGIPLNAQKKLQQIEAVYHNADGVLCDSEPIPPPPPPAPPPPPPPPVAGENLLTFHPWNIAQNWYVSPSGNDTTGDGSSGNPWQTVQKAHDFLKNTATWTGSGDVAVNLDNGTYQGPNAGAGGGDWTLDISFVSGARSPNSSRWLIWKPWHNGDVPVLEEPVGTNTAKGSIRLNDTTGANFMIFDKLTLYGGNVQRGAGGNGSSIGIYFVGNNNDNIEFNRGEIYGFQASPGTPSSAQALQVEGSGASPIIFAYNKVHDIGDPAGPAGGTTDNQEHGFYCHSIQIGMLLGNLFYNIPNGYDAQFFGVTNSGSNWIVAHNTFGEGYASGMIIDDSGSSVKVYNNIFANHTGRGSSSYGIEFFPPGTPGTGNLVDHNLYFNNTGGNQSSAPAGWTFTNELSGNPLFANQSADDYHLLAGSPAIGFRDTSYSPPYDLDGVARSSYDAGAYEFVPGLGQRKIPLFIGKRGN